MPFDMVAEQSCLCFRVNPSDCSLASLQLLAGVAPQPRLFLCTRRPHSTGDLDLLPVHRVPPEAPRGKRMQRDDPVVPSD